MKRLFIIEAPGKVRTFEAILGRIGYEARVQATRGHIFQMPEKLENVGIDSAFREFERKPRDLSVIDWIRKEAAVAEQVFVATDADAEGDVIAWDVAELISDMHPNLVRVRLKGMDDQSVREALAEAKSVEKRDAVAGRTRAIVDRLIGAGFSKNGIAVGRVSTALLGIAAKSNLTTRRIVLVAPATDGGRPFSAETDIAAPITPQIAAQLVKLKLPALELADGKLVETVPAHTGDIMVRAGDRLDISPKEASNSMQRMYEAGMMSYPRSGSRGFSPSVSLKIAEVLRKAGYGAVKKENFKAKGEQDTHEAPYPIGKFDVSKDPERLGNDEGVRTMVARDLVKAGQTHREDVPAVKHLVSFLERSGFSREVAIAVARLPWRREEGPRYPGQESWPESTIRTRRVDTVLLEHAIRNNLGRPSTWANHIETFMSRGLIDEEMNLTAKGREWAAASPPALLDPRISAAIENACEKAPEAFHSSWDREPWELNAERIVRALPPEIRSVCEGLVMHEKPKPKLDPVETYGKTVDLDAEMAARRSNTLEYAPRPAEVD